MIRCGEDSSIPTQMAIDALFGGVDTTSNTMSTFLFNIANNPQAQEKIYEEIQQVMGDDGKITTKKITSMRYLPACLKESLRLAPGTAGVERDCPDNLVIRGYQVPKGTNVMVAQQTFSRLFPRPKEFLPERWLRGTDLSQQIPSYGYLPFGHGRRKCIGNRIATMNMQILLIKLLQSYKISYNYEPIE